MYSPLRLVDLLDQKQFSDLHLILDGKLKELAELEITDEDVYIYQDQNTLTSCSTTSMIINEQNNDNQNIDITPDTISTPGFCSALQVAKGTILFNRTIF
ncbi:hypothetical protein RCL_jg191.t1 [Rhizophagus clarus]|uniref:Uncharacterized protein n=1 Tax=Rhizophagus clarus TaxID=94130 RepID=A0A8H3QKX4_9GLOM|nr:hypothetical protein RCL_jg191.t1 [Rhizophagus clarus]